MSSPEKKVKGKRVKTKKCSVPNCNYAGSKGYCTLPTNEATKRLWLELLEIDTLKPDTRICRQHFLATDFGSRQIKTGVLPSQNLVSLDF